MIELDDCSFQWRDSEFEKRGREKGQVIAISTIVNFRFTRS